MRNFTQLSYHERCQIYRGKCEQKSAREIAKELSRAVSTITRELKRNSDHVGYMYPADAHERSNARKNKNERKVTKDPTLKIYIIDKLKMKWSPKVIAGRWCHENPGRTLCAESIYQWIYSKEGKELGLNKLLARAHKKRGMKRKAAKGPKIKNRTSIHSRPPTINQRVEYGHYECDLIFNKGSQSMNILTLIERTTREVLVIRNKNKSTDTVIGSLEKEIHSKKLAIKSITFDNGSEFADHMRLRALGIETYFCDPGSPWQKGSIENCNGMLRRYLPFKMLARDVSKKNVRNAAHQLNNTPRAILGYKTPIEMRQGKWLNYDSNTQQRRRRVG